MCYIALLAVSGAAGEQKNYYSGDQYGYAFFQGVLLERWNYIALDKFRKIKHHRRRRLKELS